MLSARKLLFLAPLLFLGSGAAADTDRIEAISLLGDPLSASTLPEDFQQKQEALLGRATADLAANPTDPDALVWVGRRMAYLGRYRDAIEVFSQGIEQHPDDPRFYRHRGHRWISIRELDKAVADLTHAAVLIAGTPDVVEPDGLPNALGVPTSTLHSNIYYHLGLAQYLRGDLEGALQTYRSCLGVSANPDMLVATSHWLYMILRRLGRSAEAELVLEPIHESMEIIENEGYHQLLLMYKGLLTAEELESSSRESGGVAFPTIGYGIGNWHLYNGRPDRGYRMFEQLLESDSWSAFGFIAAEAELARQETE